MTRTRLLLAAALIAGTATAINMYTPKTAPVARTAAKEMAAPTVADKVEQFAVSRSLSGNYLSSRFAQRQLDWASAQQYIDNVLSYDGDNQSLNERAFLLSLGAKEYKRAKVLAEKLLVTEKGSDLAYIFLTADALSRDDFTGAMTFVEKLPEDGFGQYTKPLLTAWTLAGMGRTEEALSGLRAHSRPTDPTYNTHAGLIEEMAGHTEQAGKYYQTAMTAGLTLNGAVIAARFFDRTGKKEEADKIYARLKSIYPFNTFGKGADKQANITRASEGAGIALLDLATLLYERRAYDSAQVYGSLVQLLYPSSAFAAMMMGDIAALNSQPDKALESYNSISKDSPIYWFSRMRVAAIDEERGDKTAAEELLKDLAKTPETTVPALVTLGDLYRRSDRYPDAVRVYTEALAVKNPDTEQNSNILYARGMAYERMNDWEKAEKDLSEALKVQPDNPQILNFLGYTWVEKGINLDQALAYTKRAAELRPADGYILDSYGWALYQTGNRRDAVTWLERAVEEVPDDSVILDHLADAYWHIGRTNEARFKWKRAVELSKDKAFQDTLQKKILHGITDTPKMSAH